MSMFHICKFTILPCNKNVAYEGEGYLKKTWTDVQRMIIMKNNHFQTCISPSVLPVSIHIFDMATADMVS